MILPNVNIPPRCSSRALSNATNDDWFPLPACARRPPRVEHGQCQWEKEAVPKIKEANLSKMWRCLQVVPAYRSQTPPTATYFHFWPKPHCIKRGPSSRERGTAATPPLFGPCVLWPRLPISATAELLFKFAAATILFFLIFQNSRLHVGCLNCWHFNGWTCPEGRTASSCQISWLSVKPLRKCEFVIFQTWRLSAIVDLWCACLDHPRRTFHGFYKCAKCG